MQSLGNRLRFPGLMGIAIANRKKNRCDFGALRNRIYWGQGWSSITLSVQLLDSSRADGVWRTWQGSVSRPSLLDTVYPLRLKHLNIVQLMVSGDYCEGVWNSRHGLLDMVEKHIVKARAFSRVMRKRSQKFLVMKV